MTLSFGGPYEEQILQLQRLEGLVDEFILRQSQDEAAKDAADGMTVSERRERFVRTVKALGDIVDGRLYRLKAKSLEAYFKERWNMRRAQSYRFVMCGGVFKSLAGLADDRLPHRERLCRTLKKRSMYKGEASLRAVWIASLQVTEALSLDEVTSTVLTAVDETLPSLIPIQLPLDKERLNACAVAWEQAMRRPKKGSSLTNPKTRATTISAISNATLKREASSHSPPPISLFHNIQPASDNFADPMLVENSSLGTAKQNNDDLDMDVLLEESEREFRSRSNSGDSTNISSSLESSVTVAYFQDAAEVDSVHNSQAAADATIFEKVQLKPPEPRPTGLARALEQQQSGHAEQNPFENVTLMNSFFPDSYLMPTSASPLESQSSVQFPYSPHSDFMSPQNPFDFYGAIYGTSMLGDSLGSHHDFGAFVSFGQPHGFDLTQYSAAQPYTPISSSSLLATSFVGMSHADDLETLCFENVLQGSYLTATSSAPIPIANHPEVVVKMEDSVTDQEDGWLFGLDPDHEQMYLNKPSP